jgi:hypothetical protein
LAGNKADYVVITNKCFLRGAGRSTLLGQLCHTWSRHRDALWIDWKVILNNAAALPGLLLPSPPPSPSPSHLQNWRSTVPPRNALSQTQTWTSDAPSISVHVGRAGSVIESWCRTMATATALVRPSDSDSEFAPFRSLFDLWMRASDFPPVRRTPHLNGPLY